jgi:hypothetical protein
VSIISIVFSMSIITGLSPKNRDRNCGDGISRGEEGNKQVA